MGKVLFWIIVIFGGLMAARIIARHNERSQIKDQQPSNSRNRAGNQTVESMVRCEHCGIHLPRSEAFLSKGKTWCSPEHAQLEDRR